MLQVPGVFNELFICSLQLQPLGELIENMFKITVGPGGLGMAGSNSPGGKAGAGSRNLDSQGSLRDLSWGSTLLDFVSFWFLVISVQTRGLSVSSARNVGCGLW